MTPLSKADTDHGWLKLAHELAEALARADLTGTEHAVCYWVMCRTYGVRRKCGTGYTALKFTEFTQRQIGMDIGRDRKGVSRAIEDLLKKSVLTTNDRGELGFNTAVGGWGRDVIRGRDMGLWKRAIEPVDSLGITQRPTHPPLGARSHPPGTTVPGPLGARSHPPGTTVPGSSYAREESLGEKERKDGELGRPASNGRTAFQRCSYNDRGQGPCRDAVEPGSKFCQGHGFKVREKAASPRSGTGGLMSAADAMKDFTIKRRS